jgi:two-component system, NtrC family, response regulator GlrR
MTRSQPGYGPAGSREDLRCIGLVGASPAFDAMVGSIGRLAAVDLPVLLTGETGTGKELAARAIHYLSKRRDRPFVPVDCGALPDSLFAAELYGYLRGAFTDARRDRLGLAAEADGGTLFFDEVHALSLQSQAGLLRFLQDFSFRPLGAERGSRVDVRVVAATNRDLSQGAASAWFREDLYYRLNVAALAVPSLRERASDIPLLVECCIRRYCARYDRPPCRFGDASLAWLAAQPWRGNVRELESLVQRCLLADDGPLLHLEQAGEGGECEGRDGNAPGPMAGPSGPVPAFNLAKAQALAAFERGYLERVLAHHRGNVSAAARQAGKERRVFGRLMKKHGIDRLAFVYPQGESQFQS